MRKIRKQYIIVLIFMLTGIIACQDASALRVPMNTTIGKKLFSTKQNYARKSDRLLVMENQNLLKLLSPKQKKILTMLFINGKKQFAIASELKIDRSVVSKHKKAGLKKLRKLAPPNSDYRLVLENRRSLKMLPAKERKILTMLYIKRKSSSNIAGKMGIKPPLLHLYKKSGLKKLRNLIKPGSDYNIVVNNRDLLEKLANQERIVLRMLFIEEKDNNYIVNKLGISPESARQCKSSGLRKLRALLNDL